MKLSRNISNIRKFIQQSLI